jgi:hypothetical protein
LTWEVLEESGDLDDWVIDSFVAEGRTSLPEGAYSLRDHMKPILFSVPSEEEVRGLFEAEESFQQFMTGDDYSYGLADVPDSEFEKRYQGLLKAIKGIAKPGVVVTLPTVPNAFLQEAPLVDSEWIDRHTVALAEWGGRLIRKGYVLEDPIDNHPMAWFGIMKSSDGSKISDAEKSKLWQQTIKHLPKFAGRIRKINGRSYFNFNDYRNWRGRRAKWNLKAGVSDGIVVSQWNQWIEAHVDDEPNLVGVKVGKLNGHAGRTRLHVCPDSGELEEESSRRKSLLEALRIRKPGSRSEERFHQRVRSWKNLSETFLMELYTLRWAIESINRCYFDGQESLFPGEAEGLGELVSHVDPYFPDRPNW